ncbi:homeobox-containing protein 1 isoform X4 [Alosa pseudoharengus]|uniref:homeobox-containing protein 1 isoform X4 n=1 Tax=Alosa sapidissima TaxID=34773 RepID=UPI001C089602|nr:homeobox-containing protein 1 isoform X4 [Alosa sapidissima]
MRQWCLPAVAPRTEPLPTGRLSPLSDARMECCDVEPRYTIEQIDLLQRLRLSGMTKPQIIQALDSLERLDSDHRSPSCCDSHPAPPSVVTNTATVASSSSSSSSSLTSATTQTPVIEASLSPSNSYEASPPPLYPPSGVQRSFSYDLPEEDWDLEEKVEEYMRRDSNLVKEEIKAFLNNRRISQAIVGQVTGISQSYISQWLLQQGLEMSDSKRRAFYRWYLLERNSPGIRWSESQHMQTPRSRNDAPWSRQRELLLHLLPWYSAHQQAQTGATLSMRSLVKEEPDWRMGGSPGDRGIMGGPFRLRRGSRFTWRKECQSIMERRRFSLSPPLVSRLTVSRPINLSELASWPAVLKCLATEATEELLKRARKPTGGCWRACVRRRCCRRHPALFQYSRSLLHLSSLTRLVASGPAA